MERTWRDDVILETFDTVPSQFDLHRGMQAGQDIWEQPRAKEGSPKVHSHFWGSVRAYKKRLLTYENDKLNAFAGILDNMRASHGVETVWGTPESTFVMDLFWNATMFSDRKNDFPSWSWLGWTEEDLMPVQDVPELRSSTSWLSVFKVGHSEHNKLFLRRIATSDQAEQLDRLRTKVRDPGNDGPLDAVKFMNELIQLSKPAQQCKVSQANRTEEETQLLLDKVRVIVDGLAFTTQDTPQKEQLKVALQRVEGDIFLDTPHKPAMETARSIKKLLSQLAIAAKQDQSKDGESHLDSTNARDLLTDLTVTVQNAGPDPLQKSLASIMKPNIFVERALYLPTLTAEIWISACAPNGQVVGMRPSPRSSPEVIYRPTLYAYSTKEPCLKPLGLVWLQTSGAYSDVLRRSMILRPKDLQSDMNLGNTDAVSFVGDPAKFLVPFRTASGAHRGKSPSKGLPRNQDEDSSSGQSSSTTSPLSPKAASIKEALLDIGRRDHSSWQSTCALPSDEPHRSAILKARRIKKLRIAIISGPARGMRQRFGVPFAYPLKKRFFFRALVLLDQKTQVTGQTALCSERTGTCEIEVDAVEALEDAKFEDVILV